MRLLRLLLPVMPLLFFLPGTGLCGGKVADRPEGMSRPIPDKVTGTCRTIAAILSVYPALEVRKSEEPVRDVPGMTDRPGCRILASGPSSGIAGETDPAEALRDMFQGNGWTEETRYSADGPGTTSFAFRNFGTSCRVHGGAHSWIEDGKPFSSDRYELEAGCVSDPDGAGPDRPPILR